MKHIVNIISIIAAASVLLLSGCAGSMSNSKYSAAQARTAMTVKVGVVDSVRMVKIDPNTQGVGSAAGGVIGAIAGSNLGGGKGSLVFSILGAVAGGVTGHALEAAVIRKAGLEIMVKLDDGYYTVVVQEADEPFVAGDRVKVLTAQNGSTRVSH